MKCCPVQQNTIFLPNHVDPTEYLSEIMTTSVTARTSPRKKLSHYLSNIPRQYACKRCSYSVQVILQKQHILPEPVVQNLASTFLPDDCSQNELSYPMEWQEPI